MKTEKVWFCKDKGMALGLKVVERIMWWVAADTESELTRT